MKTDAILAGMTVHAAIPGSYYALCGVPLHDSVKVPNAVACPRCRDAMRGHPSGPSIAKVDPDRPLRVLRRKAK